MDEQMKTQLREAGRQDLIDTFDIREQGFAGINKKGEMVDRRECPDAIVLPSGGPFNTPAPKNVAKVTDTFGIATDFIEMVIARTEPKRNRSMIEIGPHLLLRFKENGQGSKWIYAYEGGHEDDINAMTTALLELNYIRMTSVLKLKPLYKIAAITIQLTAAITIQLTEDGPQEPSIVEAILVRLREHEKTADGGFDITLGETHQQGSILPAANYFVEYNKKGPI